MTTAIVGVGLHPFGRFDGVSGPAMATVAVDNALRDADLRWPDMEFAMGGSLEGAKGTCASPDSLVGDLGLTGLPFINVVNGCATAGSALSMACNAIDAGQYEVGIVIGYDKHPRGAFDPDPAVLGLEPWYGDSGMMLTTQFFAMKTARYMHEYGISRRSLAAVAAKNLRNGAKNPAAWRKDQLTEEQILAAPMLNDPLTKYMICSPGEGAAAVVVCSAEKARQLSTHPIWIEGLTIRTRRFGSFEVLSPSLPVTQADSPTVDAARSCFEVAGVAPHDVHVVQLQDTDAGSEIMHMAECGFCEHGEQEKLLAEGATEISGSLPVNTDGGLMANGEPIGASGLRQVYELVLQLRGTGGARQVAGDPRVGFAQVYGAPGLSACTILIR
jgi:acetyl-CoA C-acetyltransferase